MEILICTDGSSASTQAAGLVAMLDFPATSRMVLLGVSDNKVDIDKINHSMDTLEKKLSGKHAVVRKIRYGNPSQEILAEAVEFSYDLVVLGGGRRQLGLLHPKLGSTTSELSRKLHTHFLVARNLPEQIEKILVCVSGEAPTSETLTLGGAWIANTSAQIGLLHVIPVKKTRVSAASEAFRNSNTQTGENSLEHDVILERATQHLRRVGVNNQINPLVRQGLVAEEVLRELTEGEYQLMVVGAHYQPGQDLWKGTLFDDITDQLLNRSNCSVLII